MHNFRCSHSVGDGEAPESALRHDGVSPMLAMVVVVSVILVSFLVGSLTSSVETELKLPHRY